MIPWAGEGAALLRPGIEHRRGGVRPHRAGGPHHRHDAHGRLTKLFPSPRIPTDKIPECKPHIERGEHTKLYRFSPNDYNEIAAVWNGKHPETGDDLVVEDGHPEGVAPSDPPPEPAVFAPDYEPEEIAKIAEKLKKDAGIG